jgi:hypothetical protein
VNPIELPFLPATTFDPILSFSGSRDAVQKLRKELRKDLGTDDADSFWSLGRYGTVKLEPAPLFDCLVTGRHWDRKRAQHLARCYQEAGFEGWIKSKLFKSAMRIATTTLKEALKPDPEWQPAESMARIVIVLSDLIASNGEVRELAQEMTEIHRKVDASLPEVRRHPGQLVRFDGNEALVTVDVGDREELRMVHSDLFRATGIVEEGASFVLHEMSWTPGLQSLIAIPAVDIETFDEELERTLKAAETPLPRPQAEVW